MNNPAAISAEHLLDEQWPFRVSLDAVRTADLPRAILSLNQCRAGVIFRGAGAPPPDQSAAKK
ncbi:MAG: hypothetical protein DMG33_00760 [Acidobacteria bacterium]|nr:MAG: hypothetical protein DMG33_00760 [Acidobacteriota bacterium]